MARYLGPKAKLARREGTDLYLKSARRAIGDKAKFDSRPGQHGRTSGSRTSDFGLQLREKQKVKRMYGVLERQFRRYMDIASRSKGNTGSTLLSLLERRLDNIVCRMGFAGSRRQSRLLVAHGHIRVNGRKVTIPSYLVKAGDDISVKPRPKTLRYVKSNLEQYTSKVPEFLSVTRGDVPEGKVLRLPDIGDVSIGVQPTLIIEFMSR